MYMHTYTKYIHIHIHTIYIYTNLYAFIKLRTITTRSAVSPLTSSEGANANNAYQAYQESSADKGCLRIGGEAVLDN